MPQVRQLSVMPRRGRFFWSSAMPYRPATVRAAQKIDGVWRTNGWVKQGILLGFRIGELAESGHRGSLSFVDKDTYPLQYFATEDRVRVVPGGSSVRAGAYVAPGVVCMPPMFINTGAYVDEGTMVDSHALVGSCAQVGKRVHISAAAQVGGVLEPINASPVIIEDDVLLGGNTGVYEGTQVGARAVLGAGVILTRSTPLFDIVRGEIYRSSEGQPSACAGRRGGGAGLARHHQGQSCRVGTVAVRAGDREVSRRAHRSRS